MYVHVHIWNILTYALLTQWTWVAAECSTYVLPTCSAFLMNLFHTPQLFSSFLKRILSYLSSFLSCTYSHVCLHFKQVMSINDHSHVECSSLYSRKISRLTKPILLALRKRLFFTPINHSSFSFTLPIRVERKRGRDTLWNWVVKPIDFLSLSLSGFVDALSFVFVLQASKGHFTQSTNKHCSSIEWKENITKGILENCLIELEEALMREGRECPNSLTTAAASCFSSSSSLVLESR